MESEEIKNLIKLMSKIPGLGPRSARRSVLSLIKNKIKDNLLVKSIMDEFPDSEIIEVKKINK